MIDRYIKFQHQRLVALLICSLSLITAAAETQDFSVRLQLEVGLICRANVESIESNPTEQIISVTINELCNGGQGYSLTMLHNGAGVKSMSYDNHKLANIEDIPTVLATREGAWRGTRILQITTDGLQQPEIHSIQILPRAPRL